MKQPTFEENNLPEQVAENLQSTFIATTVEMSRRVQARAVINWTIKVCHLRYNNLSALIAGCIISLSTWCIGWLTNRVFFTPVSLKEAKGLIAGSLLAGLAYWIIEFLHSVTLEINRKNIFNLLGTEDSIKTTQEWFKHRFSLKSQTICSLLTAFLAVITLKFLLEGTNGANESIGIYLSVFIGMFAIGNGVYCCLKCPTLTKPISQHPARLYPYDPASTLSLKAYISIFGKLSLGCGFIVTVIMSLMLFIRPWQDQTTLFLALAWLILGWSAVTYCFIYPLTLLSAIVRKEKHRHLKKIEDLIRDRVGRADIEKLPKEEFEELKRLIDLRDAILKTRDIPIDTASFRSYITSLILPLTSFLVANRSLFSKIFRL